MVWTKSRLCPSLEGFVKGFAVTCLVLGWTWQLHTLGVVFTGGRDKTMLFEYFSAVEFSVLAISVLFIAFRHQTSETGKRIAGYLVAISFVGSALLGFWVGHGFLTDLLGGLGMILVLVLQLISFDLAGK